jgi:hypothetical protein
MAAFCGCCGAEITPRAEACPICGTPRHGMAEPPDSPDQRPSAPSGPTHSRPRRPPRDPHCWICP